MKYISIDTETTGLDPENCQILSFAAVIEDTDRPDIPVEELPSIHVILKHTSMKGEPYALNMNKDLIEIISKGVDGRLINPFNLKDRFVAFLRENDIRNKVKVAGKNFNSFDKEFIKRAFQNSWNPTDVMFHHRVLDVGSVFVDFKNDEWIPNLDECMDRAGVEGVVTHDALEDARDVIRVLRKKY